MTVQIVDVATIDVPFVDPELRSFDHEFARWLAVSISMEGLHQPITLRPNPAATGRYLLVHGLHRLHATRDILNRNEIKAQIFTDMDNATAEMTMIAENLWRTPMTRSEHRLAYNKWWEHYHAKDEEAEKLYRKSKKSRLKHEVGHDRRTAASKKRNAELADRAQLYGPVHRTTMEIEEALRLMCDTWDDLLKLHKIKSQPKSICMLRLLASGMKFDEALARVSQLKAKPKPKRAPTMTRSESIKQTATRRGSMARAKAK